MNGMDAAALLRSVGELGEFFALPSVDNGPWMPIATLLGNPDTVRDYVARTQTAIATGMGVERHLVPVKAAASSAHLSMVARLISPVIGAATCLDAIPAITAETLCWQQDSTHRPAFAIAGVDFVPATGTQQAAEVIAESLIATVLAPIGETVRAAVGLSPQILWGNIASAANGAVTVLGLSRPADETHGRALVDALIATAALAGTAEFTGSRFLRRNCCLFYQVPGGGYCGDCVLVD
jgi:ferric iron reductase protein FhuF